MKKRYQIVDTIGRPWAMTMTRIKAAKIVEMLRAQKGLICTIKELQS